MNKFKFNVLDISIIAIVIVAIAVGGFLFLKFNNAEALSGDKKTIQFSVEVIEISKDIAESYTVGESVVYGPTNSDSGKIVDVKVEPYKKLMKNTKDGKFVWSTFADKYQATVVIEAQINETATSYKGSNEEVRVGAKMPIRGKGFSSANGIVVDLKIK